MTLAEWLNSPPGVYLQHWEQLRFDEGVSDIFGFHALQLGLPEFPALNTNRMPHQWLALTSALSTSHDESTGAALIVDPEALPFPEKTLDLVLLPHTLERSCDPHACLREVARVLVPEGRVVISGFNPVSLWGFSQSRGHFYRRFGRERLFLPDSGEFIGYWRLRDWLRLLDFEVESAHFGCWRPALGSNAWLERFAWMDSLGKRWWPIFGAAYFVVAVKKVRGVQLLEPSWKTRNVPAAAAPAAVANLHHRNNDPSDQPNPPS